MDNGGTPKAAVLVVEDDEAVRRIACRILERAGHPTLSAHGGEDGLRLWEEWRERIALVLTDVVMPGLDGMDLARRLRERDPSARIVLMSGHVDPAEFRERRIPRDIPFLEKPFTAGELLDVVRKCLGGTGEQPRA